VYDEIEVVIMKNKIRNMVLISLTLILVSFLIVFAQKAQNQNNTDSKVTDEIKRRMIESSKMFSKTSSTDVSIDEGNKIFAIRRIISIYEEADKKKKMNLVEIELHTKWDIPVSDAYMDFVFVGDKVFIPIVSGRTILVRIKLEEFDEIKDNAIVHFVPMPSFLKQVREDASKVYKNGEPKEVQGAKFGRINKNMINQFPLIEEDLASFNKRLEEISKKPE
jgi:hypothetical protein